MPVQIIADSTVVESLAPKLEAGLAVGTTGAIVFASQQPRPSQFAGLAIASEMAAQGTPVVIASLVPAAEYLAKLSGYQLAMSYPQVVFIDAIASVSDYIAAIESANRRERPDNPFVRDAYALPQMLVDEVGAIEHSMRPAQNAPEGSSQRAEIDVRWMPRAKAMFGDLDREALVAAIENVHTPDEDYRPLAGKSYRVVCCDAEGTLIRTDGTLNEELHDELVERSKQEAVVVWTGGDLKAVDAALRKLGVSLPLISKRIARSVYVDEAIDDMAEEEATKLYGFRATTYRQVAG